MRTLTPLATTTFRVERVLLPPLLYCYWGAIKDDEFSATLPRTSAGGRERSPAQHPPQGLRILQDARCYKEVQWLQAADLLQQKVPKERLEDGAPRAVREAAAGVCAAARWVEGSERGGQKRC